MVWTEKIAATKKEDGTEEGVCSVCGYKMERPVAYVPNGDSPDFVLWAIRGVGGALALAVPVILIVSAVRNHGKKSRTGKRRN